jgi:hypothetical protein
MKFTNKMTQRTLGQGLNVIALPNLQCAECFERLDTIISSDRKRVTIQHAACVEECSQNNNTVIVLIEDFHETFVTDPTEKTTEVEEQNVDKAERIDT